MEFSNDKIKVFIKVDNNNNIIDINSNVFLNNTIDWIEIDEGDGDRYSHAQSNYLEYPLIDENGIYHYKFENGKILLKTKEEIQVELSTIQPTLPTEIELIKTQLTTISERNEFLEECIAEMAMKVYN